MGNLSIAIKSNVTYCEVTGWTPTRYHLC